MKLFSAQELKDWDKFTIMNEPIASIDLMERASLRLFEAMIKRLNNEPVFVFCGVGNNGGDGLAVARMLVEHGVKVTTVVLGELTKASEEFSINLKRLKQIGQEPVFASTDEDFSVIPKGSTIIDAILGMGSRAVESGPIAMGIDQLNKSGARIFSIDLPSGMSAQDRAQRGYVVKADTTFTIQQPKPSFLFAENQTYTGEIVIVDIGLHSEFYSKTESSVEFIDHKLVKGSLEPRKASSEKRDFGSSLIIGGSASMMGAVVLATKACLRCGSGLTTSYIPAFGRSVLQTAVPEAMTLTSHSEGHHSSLDQEMDKYTSISIGPGLGMNAQTGEFIRSVLQSAGKPLIIDADGLNHIAKNNMIKQIPKGSLLTPHEREFERLFKASGGELDLRKIQWEQSISLGLYILRKGKFSVLTTPDGSMYINGSGNPALAKGGSGDVLTGMITGLFARTGSIEKAAIAGVFLHGLSADIMTKETHEESLIASDLIQGIPAAFKSVWP